MEPSGIGIGYWLMTIAPASNKQGLTIVDGSSMIHIIILV